ncbi:hypothetical protein WDW37_16330 [Bdellovibrionota bacterium FG-1]
MIADTSIWIEFLKGVGLIDLAILSAARKNKLKVWTLDKNLKKILSSNECFEP